MANGITINTNKDVVFVVDNFQKHLKVYNRNLLNGDLILKNVIDTKTSIDNIEYYNNELHAGTVDHSLDFVRKKHEPDTVKVQGSLLIGKKINKYDYKFDVNGVTDGSLLDEGVSSALKYNDLIIFGSAGSNGLLVCNCSSNNSKCYDD